MKEELFRELTASVYEAGAIKRGEKEPARLTKSCRETARARARRDLKFRRALLREALSCLAHGELRVALGLFRFVWSCRGSKE
jgi:hypothetical protein